MLDAIAQVTAMMQGEDTTARAIDSIRSMLDMTEMCRGQAVAAGHGCTLPAGRNWYVNVENVLVAAGYMRRSTRTELIRDEEVRRPVTRVAVTPTGRAWLKDHSYKTAA